MYIHNSFSLDLYVAKYSQVSNGCGSYFRGCCFTTSKGRQGRFIRGVKYSWSELQPRIFCAPEITSIGMCSTTSIVTHKLIFV